MIDSRLEQRLPIILVLDNIRSLYNVGALFRVADGLNLEALYLCGITPYPKITNDPRPAWVADRADHAIRKTGLAGVESVPFHYFESTEAALHAIKTKGYQLVNLELIQESQDYRSVAYNFPLAVCIGHERDGVSNEAQALADLTVHLPMKGQGHSLNVATAASAFIYHLNDCYEKNR